MVQLRDYKRGRLYPKLKSNFKAVFGNQPSDRRGFWHSHFPLFWLSPQGSGRGIPYSPFFLVACPLFIPCTRHPLACDHIDFISASALTWPLSSNSSSLCASVCPSFPFLLGHYSKSPTYERVPFQECIRKSDLFISPTNLA